MVLHFFRGQVQGAVPKRYVNSLVGLHLFVLVSERLTVPDVVSQKGRDQKDSLSGSAYYAMQAVFVVCCGQRAEALAQNIECC